MNCDDPSTFAVETDAACGNAIEDSLPVAAADAFTTTTDMSNMALNFTKDCGFWAWDTMVAGYSSADDGTNTATNISVDMVSHMDAGGAAVVWALGIDMDDTGATDGASNTLANTLAVESNMTDWATLRAGVNHTYSFSCTEDDGSGSDCDDDTTGPIGYSANGATSYAFGLGFNWGAAQLDMLIGTELFTDPVSTMTGYSDGDLATGEVTLSYSF
jgi:hypothetical protein